jgi:hypothetical protein
MWPCWRCGYDDHEPTTTISTSVTTNTTTISSLQAGESPLKLGPKAEESGKLHDNPLSFLVRLVLGTAAGFYYFLVRDITFGTAVYCSSLTGVRALLMKGTCLFVCGLQTQMQCVCVCGGGGGGCAHPCLKFNLFLAQDLSTSNA